MGAWILADAAEWTHAFTIITGEPGNVSGDIHSAAKIDRKRSTSATV